MGKDGSFSSKLFHSAAWLGQSWDKEIQIRSPHAEILFRFHVGCFLFPYFCLSCACRILDFTSLRAWLLGPADSAEISPGYGTGFLSQDLKSELHELQLM